MVADDEGPQGSSRHAHLPHLNLCWSNDATQSVGRCAARTSSRVNGAGLTAVPTSRPPTPMVAAAGTMRAILGTLAPNARVMPAPTNPMSWDKPKNVAVYQVVQ